MVAPPIACRPPSSCFGVGVRQILTRGPLIRRVAGKADYSPGREKGGEREGGFHGPKERERERERPEEPRVKAMSEGEG